MKPHAIVFRVPDGDARRVISTYVVMAPETVNVEEAVDGILRAIPELHAKRHEYAQRTYQTLVESFPQRHAEWEAKEQKIADWHEKMSVWRSLRETALELKARGEPYEMPKKPDPIPTEELVGAEPTKPQPPPEFVPIETFEQAVAELSTSDFENIGLRVLEIYDDFEVTTFDGK